MEKGERGEGEEDEDDDRFPVFHMFVLAVAVLSSAVALTSLFPYIGFMIIDTGVASHINEAGYYSGAIGMGCLGLFDVVCVTSWHNPFHTSLMCAFILSI
jgi:hypothetical protein